MHLIQCHAQTSPMKRFVTFLVVIFQMIPVFTEITCPATILYTLEKSNFKKTKKKPLTCMCASETLQFIFPLSVKEGKKNLIPCEIWEMCFPTRALIKICLFSSEKAEMRCGFGCHHHMSAKFMPTLWGGLTFHIGLLVFY